MRRLPTRERKKATRIAGRAPELSAVGRNLLAVALALVVAVSALLLPSPASAQAKISYTNGEATINLRFIDTTTAERAVALSPTTTCERVEDSSRALA